MNQLEIPLEQLSRFDQIKLHVVLQYYDEVIKGFSNREHLAPILNRMRKRIEDLVKVIAVAPASEQRNLTIVSLKDVNLHMRKILPLLLCKKLYDDKKSENDELSYLNLIPSTRRITFCQRNRNARASSGKTIDSRSLRR